jgi:uncharacterized protein (TIGR03437 family)
VVVRFANGQLVSSGNPVSAGDILIIYANGLGDVTPAVMAGTVAPVPPAVAVHTPSATLNGQALAVSFAGLAPGFAGLYQINAKVPGDFQVPAASPVAPLTISVLGASSQPVSIAVK